MDENELSYLIRGAMFRVSNQLGVGLFESVYSQALKIELEDLGISAQKEVEVPAFYNGRDLGLGFRADLIVADKVIVEIKSIEKIKEVHHKQLINYLKLTKKKLALLVNFNEPDLSKSIFRKVNNL